MKTGLVFWSVLTALAYFYMVSAWGGYVFIINLIPLHVFVLIIMGRFSHRIYIGIHHHRSFLLSNHVYQLLLIIIISVNACD